jgi:hypothetical protein
MKNPLAEFSTVKCEQLYALGIEVFKLYTLGTNIHNHIVVATHQV